MWTFLRRRTLTQWIVVAMAVGVALGIVFPVFAVSIRPISTIFLRMIRSIIVPLIRSGDPSRANANCLDPEAWPPDGSRWRSWRTTACR